MFEVENFLKDVQMWLELKEFFLVHLHDGSSI